MSNYLKSNYVDELKLDIGGIPSIVFKPKNVEGLLPTIIHYHGWSSTKETQRMSGYTLSTLGYMVVLPDAIYHGERNPLDNYEMENAINYFWDTVFNTIDEADKLMDILVAEHGADPERFGMMGHSMGGVISSAIFTHNPRVKVQANLNGAAAWGKFNEFLTKDLPAIEGFEETEARVNAIDPGNNLELIADRPMILLHGTCDTWVDIEIQEYFYAKAKDAYKDKDKIKYVKYEELNHLLTTNMLEDTIAWFKKHL